MTKPKFRFEKPIIKSKTEPASKNVLWYFSQLKKGLTINTIKEYIKSLGWVDLFDTAPIELEEATFTENGVYENNEKGWDKVIVDVPPIELSSKTFTSNGLYTNPDGGWNLVNVNIPLNSTTITENGSYNASEGGWNEVIVDIPFDAATFTESGEYFNPNNGWNSVTVDIPLGVLLVDKNGTYEATKGGYSTVIVEVPSNESGNGYIIPYTSVGSSIVTPNSSYNFNAVITNNTYDKGFGIITFDKPVTRIASDAFWDCDSLTSIVIPDSVTNIGDFSFYNTALNSIIIPELIEYLGTHAFGSCKSLESVIFNAINCSNVPRYGGGRSYTYGVFNPYNYSDVSYNNTLKYIIFGEKVQRIPSYFLYACTAISSITIPESVTHIGDRAISKNKFMSITCKAITPPILGYLETELLGSIYVPAESVDAYKTATNWSLYAGKIQPIPES